MKAVTVPMPKLENIGSLITFKDEKGEEVCLNSLLVHEGKVYEPSFGKLEGVSPADAIAHNSLLDVALVEHVKNLPVGGRGTLYLVERGGANGAAVTRHVTTWSGTVVSNHVLRHVSKAKVGTIHFWIGRREYRGRERKNDQLLHFRRIK